MYALHLLNYCYLYAPDQRQSHKTLDSIPVSRLSIGRLAQLAGTYSTLDA